MCEEFTRFFFVLFHTLSPRSIGKQGEHEEMISPSAPMTDTRLVCKSTYVFIDLNMVTEVRVVWDKR